MTLFVSILASIAAFVGGAVALRFKDKLHIILGFSAGAVIGAALFDLIPEAIELGGSFFHPGDMLALTGVGFLAYLILDRVFSFHAHGSEGEIDQHENGKGSIGRGALGAASFCLHSIIDGVAIGLAFQVSGTVGAIVAVAVVAHRFSDGINTVGVILKHRGENKHAMIWLVAVALAPLVGTTATYFISMTDRALAIILAIFSGFFLYIGASDLIPEGHHSHSKWLTTLMTLVGAGALYLIVSVAHI